MAEAEARAELSDQHPADGEQENGATTPPSSCGWDDDSDKEEDEREKERDGREEHESSAEKNGRKNDKETSAQTQCEKTAEGSGGGDFGAQEFERLCRLALHLIDAACSHFRATSSSTFAFVSPCLAAASPVLLTDQSFPVLLACCRHAIAHASLSYRICHSCDEDEQLISPCLCKGSGRWVHRKCLQEWRVKSSRADSYHTAPTLQIKTCLPSANTPQPQLASSIVTPQHSQQQSNSKHDAVMIPHELHLHSRHDAFLASHRISTSSAHQYTVTCAGTLPAVFLRALYAMSGTNIGCPGAT
eukprot:1398179-Rhodomonas_salina.1